MKKIAVIFGGKSSEYEISLESVVGIIKAMEDYKEYEIYKIGISSKGKWYLTDSTLEQIRSNTWKEQAKTQELMPQVNGNGFFLLQDKKYIKPDILFPVLHGGDGENGVLQGVLEMMQIPYVGCGVAASAVCMNKYMLHQFARNIGIKSTPTLLVSSFAEQNKAEIFCKENRFPIFVKPNEAGSSKGISIVNNYNDLEKALQEAFQYSAQVILQKSVEGIEIGCGILGNKELILGACDEIVLEEGFFDYKEKYQMITAKVVVPARISSHTNECIKQQATQIYKFLGCKGLARLDFFVTKTGEVLLNEINTFPGFTEHSRYPSMFAAVGISYIEIVNQLLLLAQEAYNER